MNELEIKTLELEPARIEFNKQQIEDELKETLKKYEGLVFTEENTAEIRKVLAELRKGKTAADKFRLAKKKEAIVPVTEFENDIKSIVKMFDDVINPINDQLKEFEEKRRNEKRKEIERIINETVENAGLESKFASQIDIDDQYLAKSFSLNQVRETIEFVANNLLNEQRLEHMNKESIESFVKLKNSEHDMNLSVVSYLSQLEFKDVESVKNTVEQDVQKELDERMRKQVESQNEQRRKEQEEVNREHDERIKKEMESVNKSVIDNLPFGDISEVETTAVDYTIIATNEEFILLEKFMRDNDIEFHINIKELPF